MKGQSLTGSLRETLALFDETSAPLTTPEVAERLDLGRRSTYERLERLVDAGRLETKKVGASARVWWQSTPTADADADARQSVTNADADADARDRSTVVASLVDAVEDHAIFTLDADGHVRTWNPGAERLKGYEADEIRGEHVSTFYTDEDRSAGVPAENLAAAAEHGAVEDEGWRVRADGSRFWANVTIYAISDDAGDVEGFAKVTRDLTERREYEQALAEDRNHLENVLDVSPIGIGIFDADGGNRRVNRRFSELLGASDETYELGDVPLQDADGDVIPYEERPAPRALATGEPVDDQRVCIEDETGERRWLSVDAEPLADDPESVVVTMTDVTQLEEQARRLERQRDSLEAELDDVFERVDDAFYALDEAMRFTHVSERAAELFEHEEADLLGRRIWEALSVAEDDPVRATFETAMETQNSTSFERYSEALSTWVSARVFPSESGLSVYLRDVTDRHEHRAELERYVGVVDAVDEPVYELDESGRFTFFNDAFRDLFGYDDELLGEHASMVMDDEDVAAAEAKIASLLSDPPGATVLLEFEVTARNGERVPVENHFSLLSDEDGRVRGTAGMLRDVSERQARERELQESERRYRTLVENYPGTAVALVDRDCRYVSFGGSLEGDVDVQGSELEGEALREVLPPHIAEVAVPRYEAALQGESAVSEETIDDRVYRFRFVPVRDDDGEVFAATAISQEITEQKEREHELEQRVQQQSVVTDLGQRALESDDLDALFEEAASLVAETLDNDYCKVLDLDADAEELLLRQGVGWNDGIVGEASVSAVEDKSQAAVTLDTRDPIIVENLAADDRINDPELLTSHDVRSGISTVIGTVREPWGILGTHDRSEKTFTEQDANFVQAVANILATAIDRHEQVRERRQQRQQLEALNHLNEVSRDVTSAVIEQSTRAEIARTVCERLAASDSYAFAWLGDVDPATDMMELTAEAGVEGYLDDLAISVDPDDERGQGPTGCAFRTGEIQITNDRDADGHHEAWRGDIERYGWRSSAAIPVVHEDTIYGVLNVYSERRDAFRDAERAVLEQLGEVVGHAIAATDRKRALLSDELVELQFRIEDLFGTYGLEGEGTGRISLNEMVPAGDGEFLVYGTATPDAVESVEALVEANSDWERVTFREGTEEVTTFELHVTDSPVLSALASIGGYVDGAVIEDGDLNMTVHLAPCVDARDVIDRIKAVYPSAELVRRMQFARSRTDRVDVQQHLASELTDRQRASLEAAYHSGFFEWPRDASGEDVASSLDVSPPTFHQHLRKAQKKVFDSLLGSTGEAAE